MLAASVWSENVNLALDVARKIKAGTIWVNCTNVFDAASGFGGYRESGYGREGGREGLWEYMRPAWEHTGPAESDAHVIESQKANGTGKGKKKKVAVVSDDICRAVQNQGYYIRKLKEFKRDLIAHPCSGGC